LVLFYFLFSEKSKTNCSLYSHTFKNSVVIPTERDRDIDSDSDPFLTSDVLPPDSYYSREPSGSSPVVSGRQRTSTLDSYNSFRSQNNASSQRGALFRRVIGTSMLQIPIGGPDSFVSEGRFSEGSTFSFHPQFVDTNGMDDDMKDE
jgi:hypothetical protein